MYIKIKLNTIDNVNNFVKACSKYYKYEIDIKQGEQNIDGKSILGIFSLNLIDPIDVTIETDNKNMERDFYNFVKRWEVNEE